MQAILMIPYYPKNKTIKKKTKIIKHISFQHK